MKININREVKFLFLTISFIMILVSFVSAFAISSAYGSGAPIEIFPGETKDIQLKLMPSPGEDNVIIRAELIDNGKVAELTDSTQEYYVDAGEVIPVNIKININKTAKAGEEHSILIKFSDITPSKGGGSVSFKGSSTIGLDVLVVRPELKEVKGTGLLFIFGFFLLILVIAIILVIWLVVRNRNS
ncbi:MAG: hypothetical protein PHH54_04010 [Candidatus Nanoarchaeia archaeon]|nr:hypothetical protein [Candidatus Nanoarchaeia archaeon]MDD5741124.1 hypothetical protein [Candidatus Nanoarchaeia archaeon]